MDNLGKAYQEVDRRLTAAFAARARLDDQIMELRAMELVLRNVISENSKPEVEDADLRGEVS